MNHATREDVPCADSRRPWLCKLKLALGVARGVEVAPRNWAPGTPWRRILEACADLMTAKACAGELGATREQWQEALDIGPPYEWRAWLMTTAERALVAFGEEA